MRHCFMQNQTGRRPQACQLTLVAMLVVLPLGCGGKTWLNKSGDAPDSMLERFERNSDSGNRKRSSRADRAAEEHSQGNYAQMLAKGRAYESAGKTNEARATYKNLIVQQPERYEAYHRLALVADQQRRHREAQALYTQALRLRPMDGQILNDLGYCYYLQGDLQKAESALAKAIAIEPSEARYRNNLGLVYGQTGRLDAAMDSFRRGGSEADAHFNLAFVLASAGKTEQAQQRFRMALGADPNHEKARKALASFERYERQPEKLRDDGESYADGRRWVPYSENAAPAAETAGGHTSAIQARARAMMQNRMASQPAKPQQ